MKTIYLIKQVTDDGKEVLVQVAKKEWIEIIENNKKVSPENRRYFIMDCIEEGAILDCMIIEVSKEEHVKWNRLHMQSEYIRKTQSGRIVLSLDQSISQEDNTSLIDLIADADYLESRCMSDLYMEDLRKKLSLWKTWGETMLDVYLEYGRRHGPEILSQKLGVSVQTVRKYKRMFNEFIVNYFSENKF